MGAITVAAFAGLTLFAKAATEELMAIVNPALLHPKGVSLNSITALVEGRSHTDVIAVFRNVVGDDHDHWSRQCAAWEEDVQKLIDCQKAIISYMTAADAAKYKFTAFSKVRNARMTE